jgi:hypothetical protein
MTFPTASTGNVCQFDDVGASSREAVMEGHLWEYQRPGKDQAVCAWGIVLALAIVFGGLQLLWPSAPVRTSGFEIATIQLAVDKKQEDDNDEAARQQP